jgi:zinc transport system substrate-binding protein
MVFHPAWGYFADTYGLKQIPVEMEGKAPKPADLQRLVQWARSHRVNVIFVQKQFPAKSAAVIAQAIDGHVVFVDPLAEQWSDNLVSVANIFKKALR